MAFVKDLRDGEFIEQEIISLIKSKYPLTRKEDVKELRSQYDIIIPETGAKLEVKADLYVSTNMAFECMGRKGQLTGVLGTGAEYWVQFRKDKYYVWKTATLKAYLESLHGKFLRHVGDDKATTAWIIPEEKVLGECIPLAAIARHDKKLSEVF